jgi:hypothetical protein
MRLITNVRF